MLLRFVPCQFVPCPKYLAAGTAEVEKVSEVFSLDVSLYVAHFILLSTQLANSFPLFPVSLARFGWDEVGAELHHASDFCIQLLHLKLVAIRLGHQLVKVKVVNPFRLDQVFHLVWIFNI